MKYRAFIEDNFLIDEPKTGKLVPFRFNPVQEKYYKILQELGIEERGVDLPLREIILKARREGFSSLILAIFCADDILQENPTESLVMSYKDDATGTFRKRYRRYALSYYCRKSGFTVQQIQDDPGIMDKVAKQAFSIDGNDIEHKHNRAHFYCGTASARTGGRGGVLQKILFSEAAHYPDTENMTAAEVIEGTAQQVDKASGWIFQESTANGLGNHYAATWELSKQGLSRFMHRFFGWRDFYSDEQFKVIASEFTDMDMLRQEYPENDTEAFLSSSLAFTNKDELLGLIGCRADKAIVTHLELKGVNYMDQCDMIRDFIIAYEKTHPNRNLYIGIDSAKDVDATVCTIVQEKDLKPNGGVRAVAIDATGAGDFMPDWFEKNTKWYIVRVKFSRPTKSVIYKNLRVVIQDKLTELPVIMVGKEWVSEEWRHFWKEMLDLQKQIMGDMLVVAHPAGNYHDDYPDSWGLAEYGYLMVNGVPKGKRPPEESSNFDNSLRRLLNTKAGANDGEGAEDYV